MAESCDCLIVGAGPAGAALAILLARDGLRVVLVDHGRGHRSGPYETLLGGARAMLERVDLASVIGGGAEPDPLRHGAIWGEGAVAWRAGEPAGLLLRRGPFDAALRTAAAAAGVTVRCPARAAPGTHGFAVVAVGDEHAAPELWAPRLVVLATGRAGHTGVPGQRRTLALTFVGEAHAADRGSAVVEAVPCGWIWTHVPPAGPASAAVFVDEADVRTSRRGQRQFALAALAGATGPAARLAAPVLAFANDATPARAAADDGPLRIGDAAATIDPLASQGVEKALAAADHAAAVVRTGLREPRLWPRLCGLHRRWEHGLAAAHDLVAADWYRREQRFCTAAFWQRRHLPVTPPPDPATGAPLVAAPQLRLADVLVRQGPLCVEVPGVCDEATGDERTHVGHVPIPPLLGAFAAPVPLAVAVQRAGADPRLFVLAPRHVAAAMQELLRIGWLRPAASAAGSR